MSTLASNSSLNNLDTPSQDIDSDGINTFVLLWTLFLLVVGIPGNILSVIIMGSDKNNRLTTRIMMVMLAVCDTIVLIVSIFFRYFLHAAFNINLRKKDIYCRLIGQCGSFFTDLSSMVLCGIAIERFIMVTFPHSANQIVTLKTSGLALMVIILLLVVKNGFLLILIKFDPQKTQCHPTNTTWMRLDFFCFAILPYLILFTCNIYIFILLRRSRRAIKSSQSSALTGEQNLKKKEFLDRVKANELKTNNRHSHSGHHQEKSLNEIHKKRKTENIVKILLGLTLIHYIFTLPATLFQLIGNNKDIGQVLKMVLYTNYASNFFVYSITSKLFRHKVRSLFLSILIVFKLPKRPSEGGDSSFATSIGRKSNFDRSVIYVDKASPPPPSMIEGSKTNC